MTIDRTLGEEHAYEMILGSMHAIMNLDGQKLAYNTEELAEAIHVLQSFVNQHVLHRLDPDYYSAWWEDPAPDVKHVSEMNLMRHE